MWNCMCHSRSIPIEVTLLSMLLSVWLHILSWPHTDSNMLAYIWPLLNFAQVWYTSVTLSSLYALLVSLIHHTYSCPNCKLNMPWSSLSKVRIIESWPFARQCDTHMHTHTQHVFSTHTYTLCLCLPSNQSFIFTYKSEKSIAKTV